MPKKRRRLFPSNRRLCAFNRRLKPNVDFRCLGKQIPALQKPIWRFGGCVKHTNSISAVLLNTEACRKKKKRASQSEVVCSRGIWLGNTRCHECWHEQPLVLQHAFCRFTHPRRSGTELLAQQQRRRLDGSCESRSVCTSQSGVFNSLRSWRTWKPSCSWARQ